MELTQWDAVVIGGGAAGLSAAQMLGRARRRTLVLDAGSPRNRFAAHMHGVLGHDGVAPADLLARGRRELERYGVVVRTASVDRVDELADHVVVTLDDGTTESARALIVATGITDDLPDVPGLAERWGVDVLHCPYCHGWEVRGRRLGVLLVSPLQAHQAQLVRQWSDDVVVFAQVALSPELRSRLHARGVEIVDEPVVEVGDGGVRLRSERTVPVDAIFTMGAARPHDGFLTHLGLARTETPFGELLAVDATGRTSSARIWAAGNVVNASANVPVAMGAGAMAGAAANGALVEEDFDRAVAGVGVGDGGVGGRVGAVGSDAYPTPHDRMHPPRPEEAPAVYWERRYAERQWSGRPNRTIVDLVSHLAPGRALDLGCGEGADTIWLAERGWDATGLDISPTAVARAQAAAREAGVTARFAVSDLTENVGSRHSSSGSRSADSEEGDAYDLVTACFFQSPVALDRNGALRRATALVAPGGHLLIVSHAAPPSWAGPEHIGAHVFLSPADELSALALESDRWSTELADVRRRDVVAPDGSAATLDDSVVLVRRIGRALS